MKFTDWLNKRLKEEAGVSAPASSAATVTGNVAGYPRPLFMVTRGDFFPRKRKKKV